MVYILHDTESRPLAAFSIQMLSIQQNLSRLFFQQPAKAAEMVVLPTPLGPVIATTSPGRAEKDRSRNTEPPCGAAGSSLHTQPSSLPADSTAGSVHTAGVRGTQPQGLPLRVWQAAKLLPGEDALQHPAPKIKRPVNEIGEKVQAMLRHHDCAALPLQSGNLVVKAGNGPPDPDWPSARPAHRFRGPMA